MVNENVHPIFCKKCGDFLDEVFSEQWASNYLCVDCWEEERNRNN